MNSARAREVDMRKVRLEGGNPVKVVVDADLHEKIICHKAPDGNVQSQCYDHCAAFCAQDGHIYCLALPNPTFAIGELVEDGAE